MPARAVSIEERITNSHVKSPCGCWLWTGRVDKDGYGTFQKDKTNIRAHRASYEYFVGPIPSGDLVLHKCDVPGCINPEHLYVGNVQDNKRDEVSRLRHTHGEKHHDSVITEEIVFAIRNDLAETDSALALIYGVSESVIRNARNGKTWSHVGGTIRKPVSAIDRSRNNRDHSPAEIAHIRESFVSGEKQLHIAKRLGIHKNTINCIVRRKTYTHLP